MTQSSSKSVLEGHNKFERMVVLTGVSDYLNYRNRCPVYWRKKPEEDLWRKGWSHARGMTTR